MNRAICLLLACVAIVSCKSPAESNWLVGEWVGDNTGEVLTIYKNGEVKGINPDNPNERVPLGERRVDDEYGFSRYSLNFADRRALISYKRDLSKYGKECLYVSIGFAPDSLLIQQMIKDVPSFDPSTCIVFGGILDVYHKKNGKSENQSIYSIIDQDKKKDGSLIMVFASVDSVDIKNLRDYIEQQVAPVANIETTRTNRYDAFYISFVDELVEIKTDAFNGFIFSPLSIIIPKTVKRMGERVFSNLGTLLHIDIPESVEKVESDMLKFTYSLRNITGKYASNDGKMLIDGSRLVYCVPTVTGEVTIPNRVKIIGKGAFSSTVNMTSVHIPSSVELVEEGAFSDCMSLKSVSIASSVIRKHAFWNCENLETVSISSSVESIEEEAFARCSSLKSVSIASSVIRKHAFGDCNNLETVSISSSVESIEEEAFARCSSLKSVSIACSEIGESAFLDCSSLESVSIASSVEYIKKLAFGRCSSLKTVSIPSSVKEIGKYAFWACSSLKSVSIACSEIGESAFSDCSSLESVSLASSVKKIGYHAFSGCTALSSVEVYKNTVIDDAFPPSLKKDNIKIINTNNTNTINSSENVDSEEGKKSYEREQVQFLRVDDVMNYLSKHTFTSSDGLTLIFKPSGIVAKQNGSSITLSGAIRITLQNDVAALIEAHSPIDNSNFSFLVNCNQHRALEITSGINYFED